MKIGGKTSLEKDRWNLIKGLTEVMDFIEVYYTDERMPLFEAISLNTRWVVHGHHIGHGVNLAKENPNESNVEVFKKGILLASELGSKYVITHTGYYAAGESTEKAKNNVINNIKYLKRFSKQYKVELLVENPVFDHSLDKEILEKTGGNVFGISSPKDIGDILKGVKCGFLLDFAHAYTTSLKKGKDYKQFIREFMKFRPVMFHLCDGILNKNADVHMSLGNGNYDLPFFISLIKSRDVTLEISPVTLENFIESKKYIQKVLKSNSNRPL